jgi:hypothetical protein
MCSQVLHVPASLQGEGRASTPLVAHGGLCNQVMSKLQALLQAQAAKEGGIFTGSMGLFSSCLCLPRQESFLPDQSWHRLCSACMHDRMHLCGCWVSWTHNVLKAKIFLSNFPVQILRKDSQALQGGPA